MKKGSSVILISSLAGYHADDSLAMYGVTKTALFGLTKVSSSCVLLPFLFHQELDKPFLFHQELEKFNFLKYDDELEVINNNRPWLLFFSLSLIIDKLDHVHDSFLLLICMYNSSLYQ